MRTARIRYDRERCYYHAMNRVAGEPGHYPFGDVEKEHMFRLVRRLCRFYTVEILAFVAMGNHFHAVCATTPELPSPEEMRARFRDYYGPKAVEPNWEDSETCRRIGERMRDISMLMKDLQQAFTVWYNRTRRCGRRGRLWAGRFKSVILEGEHALWECIKYVEMNPVRAELCVTPDDYRFGTLGRVAGSGTHLSGAAFFEHLRQYLGEVAASYSDERVLAELNADIARVAASERGEGSEAVFRAEAEARTVPSRRLVLTRRVRYWSDGAIIGSRSFVTNLTAHIFGPERAQTKRLAATESGTQIALFAFRQLRMPT